MQNTEDLLIICQVCGSTRVTIEQEEDLVRVSCKNCKKKMNDLHKSAVIAERNTERIEEFLTKAHEREYELLKEMRGGKHEE